MKKQISSKKLPKKGVKSKTDGDEISNVFHRVLEALDNFDELFDTTPIHVSGRYVQSNGTPSFLVTTLSNQAATATVYGWGYWPFPGCRAEFTEEESIVWVKDTNVIHNYRLEDIDKVSYFGESDHPELQFFPFPRKVEDAAKLLGGLLNLEEFDKDVHTFDEAALDDVESFERQWKKLSKLRPVEFVQRAFQLPNNGLDQATNVEQRLIVFKNVDKSFHCAGFDLEHKSKTGVKKGPKYHDHRSEKYFIEIGEMCFTYETDYGWGLTRQAACLKCALDAGVIVRTSKPKIRKAKAVKSK